MASKPNPPAELNEEHRASIDRALRILGQLPEKLDRNEACGVDCKEYRDMTSHLTTEFLKLRDEFFPKVPKRRK